MFVLVAGWASFALAAPVGGDAAKDASGGKTPAEEKNPKWFSSANPFAPLTNPEAPKEKPTKPPEETAPKAEMPRVPGPIIVQVPAKPEGAPAVPKLNGILFSARLTVAIVDDGLVKVGDQVGGLRITGITADTVTAEKDAAKFVMTTRQPLAQAVPEPKAATPGKADAAPPAAEAQGQTVSSRPPETADKPPGEAGQEQVAGPCSPCEEDPVSGEKTP